MDDRSFFVRGIAPLDKRLGLTGNRVSPGVAHQLGRLAADMPQQPAIDQLREQFDVRLSVDAYRRVVEHLAREVQFRHDEAAIEQLRHRIDEAVKTTRKQDVLLLVGRDGVHVPLRESWKEAACATLAVYDRNRKRLGTAYLGEMPEKKQVSMTKRFTKVITAVLDSDSLTPLKLRYVTDAGCKVIFNQRMKQSGMRLSKHGGQHIVDLRTACRGGLGGTNLVPRPRRRHHSS